MADGATVVLEFSLHEQDEAVHLAARWAGKEAFLKAWCAAISRHAKDGAEVAYPYTLDNFPWVRIEILDDSHGVPRVILSSEVQRKVPDRWRLAATPIRCASHVRNLHLHSP